MAETKVIISREAPGSTTTDGTIPKAATAGAPPSPLLKKTTLGRSKRNLTPLYITLGILFCGFLVWLLFFRGPKEAPLTIRYAAADYGDITQSVTATGALQATTTVQVGSQVSGLVKKIFADYNTKVHRGQLLALLDTAPYVEAVTQARATLTKARSDLALAKANEARSRILLAQQLIAQQDFDATENALRDAEATLGVDSAQYEQSMVNLGYTQIRSPVDGVVQARNVDSGQTVAAGLNVTVLYVIAEDLTQMQVAANVDEADIGEVKVGQDVNFTVDAYPGEKFSGTVWQVRINPVTTQNVVTYTVIINTSNPEGKLFPGMTATVNIISDTRQNVLRVPVAAARFVPPPEFFTETKLPDTATKFRRQHTASTTDTKDTTRHHGGAGIAGASGFATIYVKSNSKTGPQVTPVHIVEGLTDANNTEVLRATPPLKPGDSVVV